ncbi:MAG: PHB depolymerase family esterase [Duganella sp.]
MTLRRLSHLAIRRALTATVALSVTAYAGAGEHTGSIAIDGRTRTYTLHLPDDPAPAHGLPLILALHGGGMQGAAMARLTALDALADARGFIVVYPDGMDKHWNDGRSTIRHPQDDVGFISALLDQVESRYPVDRRRVYATGLSNGALFAHRLGCELAPRIAAIAPVAGSMPAELRPACHPARPVAVLQISGTADPIMPYDGGAVADFGGRGEGGRVMAVTETMAAWAALSGCSGGAGAQMLPPASRLDRTRTVRTRYADCPAAGQVVAYTVEGGGHTWPGGAQYARPALIGAASRQMDASAAIVDFFLSLPGR